MRALSDERKRFGKGVLCQPAQLCVRLYWEDVNQCEESLHCVIDVFRYRHGVSDVLLSMPSVYDLQY
jgi:hypothetical protein